LGTLKGIAIVDSSGVLDFGPNYLTGTGEFRMLKNSTIKLKTQMELQLLQLLPVTLELQTRIIIFLTHNLGTFIYNLCRCTITGIGLPSGTDSILVLI